MYELYKSKNISCKNTFSVKKCDQVSKVKSNLEVNTWIDWWSIRIWPRGLSYWTHYYYTGHIIASYSFQSSIRLYLIFSFSHILSQISYFKRLITEHNNHYYLPFGRLFVIDCIYSKGSQMTWSWYKRMKPWHQLHLIVWKLQKI